MSKKRAGRSVSKFTTLICCILVAALSTGVTLVFTKSDNKPEASGTIEAKGEEDAKKQMDDTKEASEEMFFIDNWYMDTRTRFIVDGIWYRMGNIDEILDTVKKIRHTSELSWFREWNKTADRVKTIGDKSLEGEHDISAGDAYLRASNYYMAAEVFMHTNPDDPRILETFKKGVDCFTKGLELLSVPFREVSIPYEGTVLKGYFFKADTEKEKAPVLLVHQGFDAPIESTLHIAQEATRRGYNCLLFEGPGQGLAIRENGIPFRPDWEKAVTPVVDYVLTIPEVDADNIVLMGISMGGGFAVRAAAFEHRIKICVVNPGYLNIYDMFSDMLGSKLVNLYEEDPEEFNDKFLELTRYDVGIRWGLHHGMWVFGCNTPAEFMTRLKDFDYTSVLDQIQCQMLVMDGTKESWGAGQAKQLYDLLSCPKDYMLFTEEDSAAKHCQSGAPAVSMQRLFDWLDEHIDL